MTSAFPFLAIQHVQFPNIVVIDHMRNSFLLLLVTPAFLVSAVSEKRLRT